MEAPLKTLIVKTENHQTRIDKFLSEHLEETSRTLIKTLIEDDQILVNDQSIKPSYKIKADDKIDIYQLSLDTKDIVPVNLPLQIVYEDQDVLVVNKASGMVVHPAPGHYQDTLVNALMYHIQDLSEGSHETRPGIVHRIDKDTSGLLMVAKNNYAHEQLAQELQEKKTQREYIALVKGVIRNKTGSIRAPIKRDPHNRLKMAVLAGGKPAITHFEVLEVFQDASLIRCQLETGRTHQIRVHMAYINHPLVNDEIYGDKLNDYGQYLHAQTLGFTHPRTKKWMTFTSDLPEAFQTYLKKIREN